MDDTNMNSFAKDAGAISIQGHIKIYDPISKEVYIDKRNAIHYENFSIALAQSIANQGEGPIAEMVFGNGGTRVSNGIITYLTPNSVGRTATLYNQTYYKTVDAKNAASLDPARNFMETRHIEGTVYTDILITCLLDFGEPSGQLAFDNETNTDTAAFVFDELGLKAYSPVGPNTGDLLTHVIFHPVQKSLNRMIQIDYTVRIQSLSTGV
jgi:hypothetical protein